MSSCSVSGCLSRSARKVPGVTFHRFPKDETMKSAWIMAANREQYWTPTDSSRVCSVHFRQKDFDRTSTRVYLRPNACPEVSREYLRELIEEKQGRKPKNDGNTHDGDETNHRETRKTRRTEPPPPKKTIVNTDRCSKYDSKGIHKESQKDACDCLGFDCPGCFMPCDTCSSTKCGHECRQNRRWIYEGFDIEGTTFTVKSQLKR